MKPWTAALPACALLLTACGAPDADTPDPATDPAAGAPAPAAAAPEGPQVQLAGMLTLTATGTETSPDGRMCAFDVVAKNDTGTDVVNVQVAYMARTDGHGALSEYRELGDFKSGEARTGRIFVTDSPCSDVLSLTLTRAVCTRAPVSDPAQSCADAVTLDGGGVVETAPRGD